MLPRLCRAVPFDAAFWATVDPATLLFTQSHQEEIPADTIPYFIQNEFLDDDVNKWTSLARDPVGARTLAEVTVGKLDSSPRHRDIFRPLGLDDELRAVLRVGDVCWGCVCLHRAAGVAFSREEVRYVRRLAPRLAHGIRRGHLVASIDRRGGADAPGLVVLAPDGSFSTNAVGEQWLEELGYSEPDRRGLPPEVRVLAARLDHPGLDNTALPRLRLRTKAGRWAVLHASRLTTGGTPAIAVIIEQPSAGELASVLMMAYGLTRQEQSLTRLVCRGLSTREIADDLRIAPTTVQDHLKSIFDKTGVRSRRELVTAILREQYLPRASAGRPVGPSGFFVDQ